MDREARDAQLADLHAGLDGAALAPLFLGDLHVSAEELLLLALLESDLLARVTDALALVRLRRTDGADLRAHLSDLLAVDALDDDFRLARRLHRDAFRDREIHGMREAEREAQHLALHRGAVTDADELELALVALRHARHHVRDVRARGTGRHAAGIARVSADQ